MTDSIDLRELQLLQLEIAKELKRICDENDIDYFMIGGTLLGAVRHKGFIPWDDDMDFGMTVENYNKFIEIAPHKLDERFFLQTEDSDQNYHNIFAKIRMNNTHMIEKVTDKQIIHNGIFIDVFPYDLTTEKIVHSKCYMKRLKILAKMYLLKNGYNLNAITEKKISRIVNRFLFKYPMSTKQVKSKLYKLLKVNNKKQKEDYYLERDGTFNGNFVFPVSYFKQLDLLKFEDTYFKAPSRYDDYLKKAYGNYMEYPSKEKREKGHSIIKVKLDKEYQSFFKKENLDD